MKILFYIARHSRPFQNFLLDEAIATATRGPYSHSQLMFSDGACFSSWPFEGVRFAKNIPLDPYHWVWFDLPISEQEEAALRAWCEGEVGCGYDYIGAITLSPAIGEKWFCSEICIASINATTHLHFQPCLSPNGLYIVCNKLLGVHADGGKNMGLHAIGGENPSHGFCDEFNSH